MKKEERTRVGIDKKKHEKCSKHGNVCWFMCEIQMRDSMGQFRPLTPGRAATLQ